MNSSRLTAQTQGLNTQEGNQDQVKLIINRKRQESKQGEDQRPSCFLFMTHKGKTEKEIEQRIN